MWTWSLSGSFRNGLWHFIYSFLSWPPGWHLSWCPGEGTPTSSVESCCVDLAGAPQPPRKPGPSLRPGTEFFWFQCIGEARERTCGYGLWAGLPGASAASAGLCAHRCRPLSTWPLVGTLGKKAGWVQGTCAHTSCCRRGEKLVTVRRRCQSPQWAGMGMGGQDCGFPPGRSRFRRHRSNWLMASQVSWVAGAFRG